MATGIAAVGAALAQRPELFRAVVAEVAIFDMLRFELDPNGQFNVTEFGSVKDPDQFRALSAYSPYHQIRDGVKYPAVFMSTGENDGRVNPMHSRKMAAALKRIRKLAPELEVDGEMQGDAALLESLRERVFPDSRLKGTANLLIMPNLDSANIAFQMVKVLADPVALLAGVL